MQALFFSNFTKKSNSTKVPDDATGTIKNVELKAQTSIEKPTLLISNPNFNYNYVKIFNRYYFIDDIVLGNNNIYMISCTQDILATYKNEILNSNCYVERAASAYDININDNAITSTQDIIQSATNSVSMTNILSSVGTYIMRVAGKDGINTFAMTEEWMYDILDFMFADSTYAQDALADLANKSFFNPFQYILDVFWLPINILSISGTTAKVYFGWWYKSGAGKLINNFTINNTYTINKADVYYGDFRDYNPHWTQANLYLPIYGYFELDPIFLKEELKAEYYIDILTGQTNILILVNDIIVANLSCSAKVPYQIANTAPDVWGGMGNVINGAANLVSGVASGNPISGTSSAISDFIDATRSVTIGSISVNGSVGNRSMLANKTYIDCNVNRFGSKSIPTSVHGRPLHEFKTLSTLSGFVKTLGASIDIDGYNQDRDDINSMLNSGIYIE